MQRKIAGASHMVMIGGARGGPRPMARPVVPGLDEGGGAIPTLLIMLLVAAPAIGVAFWLPELAAHLLNFFGARITADQIARWTLAPLILLVVAGVFELIGRSRYSPLRPVWMYWAAFRRTATDSALKPSVIGAALALLFLIVLTIIFARSEALAAWNARALTHFVQGGGMRVIAASIGLAALAIGLRSLKDYFFDGEGYLAKVLAKQTPRDELMDQAPPSDLSFYHGLLRFAGAIAFACELLFQTVVFGLVSWSVATAFPQTQLFSNPDTLSPQSAILFWSQSVFALVDGPNVFGVELSPLRANPHVWPFGVTIIFFKLFVISLIVRLFQHSLHLRPQDISSAWAQALERR